MRRPVGLKGVGREDRSWSFPRPLRDLRAVTAPGRTTSGRAGGGETVRCKPLERSDGDHVLGACCPNRSLSRNGGERRRISLRPGRPNRFQRSMDLLVCDVVGHLVTLVQRPGFERLPAAAAAISVPAWRGLLVHPVSSHFVDNAIHAIGNGVMAGVGP